MEYLWMQLIQDGYRWRSCWTSQKKQELEDFQPPLDIVDGAARVMDPLFDGINTENIGAVNFKRL
jgi:hypothetical protein